MEPIQSSDDTLQDLYFKFRPNDADELKLCIEEAFADAIYPGDDNIIVSGYPDCCAECSETQHTFQGKHWRDLAVPSQLQTGYWGGLGLLKPEAWWFFLPAYLIVSLSGGDDAEDAMDRVLWALTPRSAADLPKLSDVIDYEKKSEDSFLARAFSFTRAQLECLSAYMCAVAASEPDHKDWAVLAAYWKARAEEAKAEQAAL